MHFEQYLVFKSCDIALTALAAGTDAFVMHSFFSPQWFEHNTQTLPICGSTYVI